MYCIIGAHGFMGLFQPFFLQKVSCTSDQSGRKEFMLEHPFGTCVWKLQPPLTAPLMAHWAPSHTA